MSLLSTDLLDFKLVDGDMVVGPNGFETVAGPDGVAQLCSIAIKLFLREWFLNQERGIDWFDIFQKKFDRDSVQADLRRVLSRVPGVSSVISVVATIDSTRQCHVTVLVKSLFGDVEVTASVEAAGG